ncbi:permease [bacterium (Candidatus Blackallbacteria) CG17_big_fil_post_rev_8_21_14_2_50_48_46]|uniref:Probable membrane transporter protein n=1 Tax=bacterium (Candidatus Blackallbacteria) CG17_big_fil_post_rev_8_21_14_2_50_48_46 TaxID=2014261 RepID=A0A2M7G205_9BACT|nr:MAG: permease [bacterium (Candidatus Blackallbacteria) CG18_big_fil_WC_8_21_14_2_50_49_26]PIW15799.1 MAG: permease [bacterium (Candidatus Blackallbacteria) CG17_big_fil_post_rev_8_21_14_2_50_48_46]PIW47784.1 MAG: permease [bacterium (Candidatus Blackallbacteria) CG13_big_fil_rev_8_21_14_2_50_49_14]
MELIQIFGYVAAVFMGGVLGLIGGGGSILTVPILVYLFKTPPVLATAYSLFIVGLTSIFGMAGYIKARLVNFKVGIIFSIPAMIGVFSSRKFIVPAIPKHLFHLGSVDITKDMAIMGLFAIMMVLASFSMIKSKKEKEDTGHGEVSELKKIVMVSAEGLIVGILTGLVGAGGGFLVIPVLVIFAGLDMKEAVATSLLVISIKSLFGFMGDLGGDRQLDWMFLGGFSVFTIVGALLGTWVSKFVSSEKLKPAFGWFVLVMGIFVLLNTGISGGH